MTTWLRVSAMDLAQFIIFENPTAKLADGRVMKFVHPNPQELVEIAARYAKQLIENSRSIPSSQAELLQVLWRAFHEPVELSETTLFGDERRRRHKTLEELFLETASILATMDTSRSWRPMETAPRDGTVIEACARVPHATAGFPQYIDFLNGRWQTVGYARHDVIPWCWRPRDDRWPDERAFSEKAV